MQDSLEHKKKSDLTNNIPQKINVKGPVKTADANKMKNPPVASE